jgi:hypothetical protein
MHVRETCIQETLRVVMISGAPMSTEGEDGKSTNEVTDTQMNTVVLQIGDHRLLRGTIAAAMVGIAVSGGAAMNNLLSSQGMQSRQDFLCPTPGKIRAPFLKAEDLEMEVGAMLNGATLRPWNPRPQGRGAHRKLRRKCTTRGIRAAGSPSMTSTAMSIAGCHHQDPARKRRMAVAAIEMAHVALGGRALGVGAALYAASGSVLRKVRVGAGNWNWDVQGVGTLWETWDAIHEGARALALPAPSRKGRNSQFTTGRSFCFACGWSWTKTDEIF